MHGDPHRLMCPLRKKGGYIVNLARMRIVMQTPEEFGTRM